MNIPSLPTDVVSKNVVFKGDIFKCVEIELDERGMKPVCSVTLTWPNGVLIKNVPIEQIELAENN